MLGQVIDILNVAIPILTQFLPEYVGAKSLDALISKVTSARKEPSNVETVIIQLLSTLDQSLKEFCTINHWEYDSSAIVETFPSKLQEANFRWTSDSMREILDKAVGATANGFSIEPNMLNLWEQCFYVALSAEPHDALRKFLEAREIKSTSECISHLTEILHDSNPCKDGLIKAILDKKLSSDITPRVLFSLIVQHQQEVVLKKHTSTAMGLSLHDVFTSGYYVEPPYMVESGSIASGYSTLSEAISNSLFSGKSVLVHGEAGYGKTTILAKSFSDHVNAYLNGETDSVPLFLALREKGKAYQFSFHTYLDEEIQALKIGLSILPMLESTINPVFYCDGFDEIAEQMSLSELDKIRDSEIFNYPLMLTCRYQYAIRYIRSQHFTDKFSIRVQMSKWTSTTSEAYIKKFCAIKKLSSSVESKLINSLKNENITSVLDSPLLLSMYLWFIEQNRMETFEDSPSLVSLFKNYIIELASRECEKLNIKKIITPSGLVDIWSYSSWLLYKYKTNGKNRISFTELFDNIQSEFTQVSDNISPSWFEAMFDSNNEFLFDTFHEQFMEYMVARVLVDACARKVPPYPEFLRIVMRPEINRYIRAIWHDNPSKVRSDIVEAIYAQYRDALVEPENSVLTRVNAIYYIERMPVSKQEEYVTFAFKHESHISVKLSLYFGEIKRGKLEAEERFCSELDSSTSEYNEANRGYHLAYYSDSIPGKELPFEDDISREWKGTLKAFERHFKSDEQYHYFLRRVDLITMKHLIEARGHTLPLTDSKMNAFEQWIENSVYNKQYSSYFEKTKLAFQQLQSVYNSLKTKDRFHN